MDNTDHGGDVTYAASNTVVLGTAASLESDMTDCPKCQGDFKIICDGAGAKPNGKCGADEGDMTECGARLIASLSTERPLARILIGGPVSRLC